MRTKLPVSFNGQRLTNQARLHFCGPVVLKRRLVNDHVTVEHEVVKEANCLVPGFEMQQLDLPTRKAILNEAAMKAFQPGMRERAGMATGLPARPMQCFQFLEDTQCFRNSARAIVVSGPRSA